MRVICDGGFADDVCSVAPAVRPLPGALEEQELRVVMDEITHACAVTVHRSQGSEYADGMGVRTCDVARAAQVLLCPRDHGADHCVPAHAACLPSATFAVRR